MGYARENLYLFFIFYTLPSDLLSIPQSLFVARSSFLSFSVAPSVWADHFPVICFFFYFFLFFIFYSSWCMCTDRDHIFKFLSVQTNHQRTCSYSFSFSPSLVSNVILSLLFIFNLFSPLLFLFHTHTDIYL